MAIASQYEERARRQIRQWKRPEQSWFDRAIAVVSWPLDKTGQVFLNTPGIGPAIQRACSGTFSVINDLSNWSVRPNAILSDYRRLVGDDVATLSDIYRLDLESVDRAIGWLDTKYEGLALTEGAVAGSVAVLRSCGLECVEMSGSGKRVTPPDEVHR